MPSLRSLLHRRQHLALLLIALALAMKALLPAGFMLSTHDSMTLSVTLCNGPGQIMALDIPVDRDTPGSAASDQQPCQAGMGSMPFVGDGAPGWVVAAIAFVLALGFASVIFPVPGVPPFRLPPSRGPPTPA